MEWRLLDTGVNNAFYNMAVDEANMQASRLGLIPPTIRFYQWNPPGLSLGYFQKAEEEIDQERCLENNFDIVRRLTGGRAILHDDELTYSIVVREDSGILPDNILSSYKIISEGIIQGLQSLGIAAELKSPRGQAKSPQGFSAACFDAPSWYEVVVDGKKLVGSAQVRKQGVILQHGSIPLTIDAEKLYGVLKFNNQNVRDRLKRVFLQKATAVNWLISSLTVNDLKKSLKEGWEERFGVKLVTDELLSKEREWTTKFMEEKYQQQSWNFKK